MATIELILLAIEPNTTRAQMPIVMPVTVRAVRSRRRARLRSRLMRGAPGLGEESSGTDGCRGLPAHREAGSGASALHCRISRPRSRAQHDDAEPHEPH